MRLLKNLKRQITANYTNIKKTLPLSLIYAYLFNVNSVYAFGVWSVVSKVAGLGSFIVLVVILPGLLLWLSVEMFNSVLDFAVLDFTKTITGHLLWSIKQIWTSVRDITNILIIGSFVYISIAKILSLDKDFKKMVINLLVVAVLINFSFFFTLVAIDTTNWMSVQIYNSIIPAATPANMGLGEVIVHNMGGVEFTGSLYNKVLKTLEDGMSDSKDTLTSAFLGSLFYIGVSLITTLIAAVLFFRITFILIGRSIILFILLASSSFAFAAKLIPPLKDYWAYWRDGLIYNSVVAPLLLLLLWAVTVIMSGLPGGSFNPSGSKTITSSIQDAGYILTLIRFMVGLGLLWGAIRIATMLANKAASSAGSAGKGINNLMNVLPGILETGLSRGASSATLGLAGTAGRGTLGFGGQWMSDKLGKIADNTKSRRVQRALNSMANSSILKKMKDSSYDARNNKKVQESMKKAGINLGSGVKDGFKKLKDSREAQEKKHDANQEKAFMESKAGEAEIERNLKTQTNTLKRDTKQAEREIAKKEGELNNIRGQDKREKQSVAGKERTVKEKERRVADIKERRNADSNIVEETKAAMAAEERRIEQFTTEVNNAKANGDDGLANALLDKIKESNTTIENLNKRHREAQNNISNMSDADRANNLEVERSYQSAMVELAEAKVDRDTEIDNYTTANKERVETISSTQQDIDNLHTTIESNTSQIEDYEKSINNYINSWREGAANLNTLQNISKLSEKDKQWLIDTAGVQLGVDSNGNEIIAKMPGAQELMSLGEDNQEKLGKLLKQFNDYNKTILKTTKSTGLTDDQRKEKKRNKAFVETMTKIHDSSDKTGAGRSTPPIVDNIVSTATKQESAPPEDKPTQSTT